ncbi:hypothetical protein PRZ48_010365 [Zasmidium cellare]|uniref:Uncharacterized protein n=1 Tax=Zasmidium cellare TaxID=395010 RepID=A0ABR0E8F2_ZASCE|nr:hypothetical protein PRZ48_010365 [Zasmidium cellare]
MARNEANQHVRLWREGVEGKYFPEKRVGRLLESREDFDGILWDYDSLARHYIPLLRYTLHIWTKGDLYNGEALKRGYLEHNQHIKDIVPKENLLTYRPGDGWEPLCRFLGKDVPDTPFPKANAGNAAAVAHEWIFPRERFLVVGRKVVKGLLPIGAVVAAVWIAMRTTRTA